ncbi:MAG: PKD domain-containing protein [Saprospiraceae bacterium]|nr:PKD domain-containing protein [Saprospiraceae bacterium]
MSYKIFSTSIFLIFLSITLLAQSSKKVFFIGNSYIYVNSMPSILNSIANSKNDTIIYSSSTPGGAQLIQHVSNTATLNGIRQGNWDFVVIQEQSQKPSFSPGQVANDVLPYAQQLNDTIEKYNPCGETAFFMTWGRKNGDQSNCAVYPPICTYDGMQERLRSSYLLMSQQNNAICSPVGAAWKVVRDSFPNINLYNADESHPSYAGSYLAACTFYATLFRKSPVGSAFYGNLSATDALTLQNIAALVVLDSMTNWFIGNYDIHADFTYSTLSDSVSFTNNSSNGTTYIWDFGDNSPSSTDANPTHVYDSSGNYFVTLISSDGCDRDTMVQNISISIPTTASQILQTTKKLTYYPNPTTNKLNIECKETIDYVRIINSVGAEITYINNINSNKYILDLSIAKEGIYYLMVKPINGEIILNKLILL